ncbi:MAG: hypothetical protein IJU32_08130 [Pyramidobacter sp.]|nr:hypothetical protein [Pyramidobacter sp.]
MENNLRPCVQKRFGREGFIIGEKQLENELAVLLWYNFMCLARMKACAFMTDDRYNKRRHPFSD